MAIDIGKLTRFQAAMHHALARGARPAIREKDLGIWQTWTWKQFADEVRFVACGLAGLGLARGEHFALVGDNRPRFYATMAAAQCLGAIPVPLYQDAVAAEMAFPIQNASIAFAFAEDQEQVDKLLEILPQCPTLKKIVFAIPRPAALCPARARALRPAARSGARDYRRDPLSSRRRLPGSGSDTAAMFSPPDDRVAKGVVHTHASLLIPARTAAELEGLGKTTSSSPTSPRGRRTSFPVRRPSSGLLHRLPRSSETVMADMREIGPTYYFAPPRVLENLLTQVSIRIQDLWWGGRWAYGYFMAVANRVGGKILEGKPVPVGERLLYFLGELFLYGPLRNVLGMSRVKVGYTAGEAIGPDLFKFYRSIGINLKQLYGSTEPAVC